jgi:hypothetical protein
MLNIDVDRKVMRPIVEDSCIRRQLTPVKLCLVLGQ